MSVPGPPASSLAFHDKNGAAACTGEEAGGSSNKRRHQTYLFLTALAVLRLWVMPMTSSLWLDETTTYWSACKGVSAAVARSQFWPGQNLLYSMIAALAIRLGGHSEFVLRLPSLLAALATVWVLFKLGTRLGDREMAALSVATFVSLQAMFETAANARPYALGLFFVVASTWQLVRWLDTSRKRDSFLYVVLAATIPYFHYLFAPMFLVHGLYAWYRTREGAKTRLSQLWLAGLAVLLLLSPLGWNAIAAHHVSAAASFTSTPDFEKLFSAEMPAVLGTGIFVGMLLGYWIYGRLKAEYVVEARPESVLLLITWFLVPILILFLISRFSEYKLFVSRYYLPAFPALALLVGWGMRNLEEKIRVIVSACVVLTAIASFGTHHLWVNPYLEDWRGAAKEVRSLNISQSTPVLVRTGLIETEQPTWGIDIDPDSPLLAPLAKYPVPGHIFLVPSGLNSNSVRYMNELSSRILDTAPEFVYLARDVGDPYQAWLSGRFSSQFTVSKLGHADGVAVFLYHRIEREKQSATQDNTSKRN